MSRPRFLRECLPGIGKWGYHDAGLEPLGLMSPEEVAHWIAAIAAERA